jgi:hypothetical protein
VPQCVNIPPPQADLMLEDRAHMLTLSPPGTASVIVALTRPRQPGSPARLAARDHTVTAAGRDKDARAAVRRG